MPKYLLQGSYTQDGLKGLMKDGASKRREVIENMAKSVDGKVETFYFAFGSDDFFLILDLPSAVEASALSFAANASGAVKGRVTVLITPDEVDQATKRTVAYRPPGQ